MNNVEQISIGNIGKIVITENLKKQIDYLHRNIGATEWSGILVYKHTEGDIKNLKDLVFVADNLFLMDIGSSTLTEFKYDEDIVKIYEHIPDAMESCISLIHSHHQMAAFHSGTDIQELETNAGVYNYYISLVVNFAETYVCKIAFPAITEATYKSQIRGTDGELIPLNSNQVQKNIHYLGDLTVEIQSSSSTDEWFSNRYLEVKKAKETKPVYTVPTYNSRWDDNTFDWWEDKPKTNSHVNSFKTIPSRRGFLGSKQYSKKNKSFDVNPDRIDKTTKFVNAIIWGDASVPINLMQGVAKLNLLDFAEYDIYEELLETNVENFHETIYGTDNMDFLKHVEEAICTLDNYTSPNRTTNIDHLIDFLDEYATIQ